MSSFTKNGISVVPPVGSIMAYLGTTSPDGWIMCNGISVDNSDGKYNDLSAMGIGSVSGTSYIPPDLSNRFLHQTNGTIKTDGGSSTATLNVANIPSHTHIGVAADHTHTITVDVEDFNFTVNDPGHTHASGNPTYSGYNPNLENKNLSQIWGDWFSPNLPVNNNTTLSAQTDITVSADGGSTSASASNASLTPEVGYTGSDQAFSIMPPYYTVNYILKY
jgi:microcystin-dependent protein